MGNIIDYLEWRGDIPFTADPVNEVDDLLFAELAYINFVNIPADGTPVSLEDACEAYCSRHPEKWIGTDKVYREKEKLFGMMARAPRFRNTGVCFYADHPDAEQDVQFNAVTFLLEDGTAYAAFRGTDHSFTDWKESLDLSYQTVTKEQKRAVEYLNGLEKIPDRSLRAGGHSKGGNLAVYGAAFCSPSVRDRITEVFSADGPGFRDEIIMSEEYRSILPKIINVIPSASVVGRLMLNASIPRVVQSSAIGIHQHNALTWNVKGNRFERTGISEMGVILNKSMNDWAGHLDDETRKSLIISIFSLLEGTGKDNFQEIKEQKRKSLEALLSGMSELPENKRRELIRMLRQLLRSGGHALASEAYAFAERFLEERASRRRAPGNNEKG